MNIFRLAAGFFTIAASALLALPANADMITPKSLIIDGNERADSITVTNTSNTAQVYRVRIRHVMMKEDGSFVELDSPLPNSAHDMVRFSPKRFTLAPGAGQVVRIMAVRPQGLPEGEYMTMIAVLAEPPPFEQGKGVQVAIARQYGIPLMVVNGNRPRTTAAITSAAAHGDRIVGVVSRTSGQNFSGCIRASNSAGETVGMLDGFAIYEEVSSRTAELAVEKPVSPSDRLVLSLHDTPKCQGAPVSTSDVARR